MSTKTKRIPIKNMFIGGGSRVSVQSMTTVPTSDVCGVLAQIKKLEAAGCDIVRGAVTNEADALAVRAIVDAIKIPFVADIQFDHKLAILSIENGADKVRINPGNIGGGERVRAVCDCARAHDVPIRIGINGGSLEKDIEAKYGQTAQALAESALRNIELLEDFGFSDIIVSVKSSSVREMTEAYRTLSRKTDYPLHLGVTEAGSVKSGVVKSAIGIGALLADGIGDTIRVSLTGDPVHEVAAGRDILRALGLDRNFVEVISCPTCARCGIDLASLVEQVEVMTAEIKKPLKVAVMGCVVNGPGEAREADLGIAAGPLKSVIFKKGKPLKTVGNEVVFEEFIRELSVLL